VVDAALVDAPEETLSRLLRRRKGRKERVPSRKP
jgi:hypothetical protein